MRTTDIGECIENMINSCLEDNDRILTEEQVEKMIDDKVDGIEVDADKVNGLDRAIESAIDDADLDDKIDERVGAFVETDAFQTAVNDAVKKAIHTFMTNLLNV